jgi:hypothetical protein
MKTLLEIAVAGEAGKNHPIERRTVVGSGPGADVVVTAPCVAPQHFRLLLGPRHIELKLAPGVRPLHYEGKAIALGKLAYGRDFYLEQVRFNCAAPVRGDQRARWPWLFLLVVVSAAAGLVLAASRDDRRPPAREDVVELFAAEPPCPEQDPVAARRHAEQTERAAQARLERRRYDAHDGVVAGRLYAEAAACFSTAGDEAERERSERVGAEARERVTEELRAAQIRLRAALANEQHLRALEEITALRRLLRDEPHPYGRWLGEKERELLARKATAR